MVGRHTFLPLILENVNTVVITNNNITNVVTVGKLLWTEDVWHSGKCTCVFAVTKMCYVESHLESQVFFPPSFSFILDFILI